MEWWSDSSLFLSSSGATISYLSKVTYQCPTIPYNEKKVTCETSLWMMSGLSTRAKIIKTCPAWVGQHEKKQWFFKNFVQVLWEWLSLSQWSQDQRTNPKHNSAPNKWINPKAKNEEKQCGEKKQNISGKAVWKELRKLYLVYIGPKPLAYE